MSLQVADKHPGRSKVNRNHDRTGNGKQNTQHEKHYVGYSAKDVWRSTLFIEISVL